MNEPAYEVVSEDEYQTNIGYPCEKHIERYTKEVVFGEKQVLHGIYPYKYADGDTKYVCRYCLVECKKCSYCDGSGYSGLTIEDLTPCTRCK